MLLSSPKFIIAFVTLSVLAFGGCESDPRANVTGGNPPVFRISSGTGNLLVISVHEYRIDKSTSSEQAIEIWRVEATRNSAGQMVGRRPTDIDTVTYGVVPDGYRQITPVFGNASSLSEGTLYSYEFQTEAGMPTHGDFEIRSGVANKVRVAHNCIVTGDGGKKLSTPCTYFNE